ncbi:hypothetical protein ACGFYQ_40700 [Streptomyces sp. NPDC048258]|uniref:hypothetical protein n=1 Tax=Streptomyces sp. NPDC048258 TaxID=3365527 RepID=UPI0037228048
MKRGLGIAATLATVLGASVIGAGSAHAQDPVPILSGLISPLLCGAVHQNNGDNNTSHGDQTVNCNQTGASTTPPSNGGGLTGYIIVPAESQCAEDVFFCFVTANCPEGTSVTGGGFNYDNLGQNAFQVLDNQPTADGSGWFVRIQRLSAAPATTLRAHAICADVAEA